MKIQVGHISCAITVSTRTVLAGVVGLIIGLLACKETDPDAWLLQDPAYKGWHVQTYENVRVYYPDGHPRTNLMPTIAERSHMAYLSIAKALGMPEPKEILKVVYYTGMGQGIEMTKHPYPFADSMGVARYWPPYAPGIAVAELMVRKWDPTEPKMRFLYHGLVTLFDFSGEDYHKSTAAFSQDTTLISLAKLAVDTTVNMNEERWQSAEAASFCAYLIGNYGLDKLRALYRTDLPPSEAFLQILGKPIDTIQAEWLAVARMAAGQPTSRDTSLHK